MLRASPPQITSRNSTIMMIAGASMAQASSVVSADPSGVPDPVAARAAGVTRASASRSLGSSSYGGGQSRWRRPRKGRRDRITESTRIATVLHPLPNTDHGRYVALVGPVNEENDPNDQQ